MSKEIKESYIMDVPHDGYMEFESIEEIKDYLRDISDDGFPIEIDDAISLYKKCGHLGIKVTDEKSNYNNPEDWEHSDDWEYVGEWEVVEDTPNKPIEVCTWVRAFDGHFNLGCCNDNHERGNGNFKPDAKIKTTKWDFKYCPYCGKPIEIQE